jgi:hypothetical protein
LGRSAFQGTWRLTFLCILLAALAFGTAVAQTQQLSWWDRAQAIYQKAVDQGRPLAEKFARQFPKRFETLRQNTLHSIKHGQKVLDDADLEQKKNFALELWRIRQSLDLATLFSAPVLKELTGLDVPTLAALKSRVVKMEKSLEAQIAQLSKR